MISHLIEIIMIFLLVSFNRSINSKKYFFTNFAFYHLANGIHLSLYPMLLDTARPQGIVRLLTSIVTQQVAPGVSHSSFGNGLEQGGVYG